MGTTDRKLTVPPTCGQLSPTCGPSWAMESQFSATGRRRNVPAYCVGAKKIRLRHGQVCLRGARCRRGGRRSGRCRIGRRGETPLRAVEPVLLREMEQGHGGNADLPGALDEIEDIPTGGLGMRDQELSDRPGVMCQQPAAGSTGHAMVGRLDHLLGRYVLLLRRRRSADAEDPGNLGHLQARLAVQQKMTTRNGEQVRVKSVAKYSPEWASCTSTTEVSVDAGRTWKHWWNQQGEKVKK